MGGSQQYFVLLLNKHEIFTFQEGWELKHESLKTKPTESDSEYTPNTGKKPKEGKKKKKWKKPTIGTLKSRNPSKKPRGEKKNAKLKSGAKSENTPDMVSDVLQPQTNIKTGQSSE